MIFRPKRAKSQLVFEMRTHGTNFVPQKFRHVWDIISTFTEKFWWFCTWDSLTTDILSVNSRRNEKKQPRFSSRIAKCRLAVAWHGHGKVESQSWTKISIGMTLIIRARTRTRGILAYGTPPGVVWPEHGLPTWFGLPAWTKISIGLTFIIRGGARDFYLQIPSRRDLACV